MAHSGHTIQATRAASQFKFRKGPDGLHGFCRSSGVNVLLDEYSIPEDQWSAAPQFVSIALTNACDLKCSHCYAPKHGAQIDYIRLLSWIDELDQAGCLGVGFGGGEPTLYRRLPDVLHHIQTKTSLAASLTTHGLHFTKEYASRLAGSVNFIRVSMDGVGQTYERIRGAKFERLISSLNYIREISPIGINFVVNETTFPCLDAALEIALEIDASQFVLLPERKTLNVPGIDIRTQEQLSQWIEANSRKIAMAISAAPGNIGNICDPLPKENGFRSYAHIDADGFLKASSFVTRGVDIGTDGILDAIETIQATN